MTTRRQRSEPRDLTLAQLLADLKRTGQKLEDLPPAVVREAQKRGFPDMRSILLPPPIIKASLHQPLLRELLVTRVGYCSRAKGHFIPRPQGSLDNIIVYCVAGKGLLRIGGKQWNVPPNTALFIPHGVPHTYKADATEPWSIYWIHFTGRLADDFFAELQVSASQPLLHLPSTEEVLSVFEAIYGHMAAVHTRHNLVAATTALARYLGLIQLRRYATEDHQRTDEENVQQTIEFMNNNLARHVALRELAQLAHMSVRRYQAAFLKRTDSSPITYFTRMRMQKAGRLLRETDRAMKEIAAELGFEDPFYFSRLFKKYMGVSPVNFRR